MPISHPTDLGQCRVVLDANELLALYANNAVIPTIPNDGSELNALQPTAGLQAVFKTTGGPHATRPYVQKITNAFYDIADSPDLLVHQSVTLVLVARFANFTDCTFFSKWAGAPSGGDVFWHTVGGGGVNFNTDRPWIQGGVAKAHGASVNTWRRFYNIINGTSLQYYIDGVAVGTPHGLNNGANTAHSLRIGRSHGGDRGGAYDFCCAIVFSRALTAGELADLDAWIVANFFAPDISFPPTQPGAFTNPTATTVVDLSTVIAWGASTDPESNPFTYQLELSDNNGASWSPLAAGLTAPSYNWTDAFTYPNGVQYKLRVRACDAGGCAEWRESDTFAVTHPPPFIATPTMEWVWHSHKHLGFLASPYVGTIPVARSEWEFSTTESFASPFTVATRTDGLLRLGHNGVVDLVNGAYAPSSLFAHNTDYYCRMRYVDQLDNVSEWSNVERGRTARDGSGSFVNLSAPLLVEDASGNNRWGIHCLTCSNPGTPPCFSAVIDAGARFPYHLISGGASDLGLLLGRGEYVRWQYTFPTATPLPNFRIYLRAFMISRPPSDYGLFGLRNTTTGGGWLNVGTRFSFGPGLWLGGPVIAPLGAEPAIGQPFLIDLVWDNVEGKLRYNGAVVVEAALTSSMNIISGIVGHANGHTPVIGGGFTAHIILLEYEFWWAGVKAIHYNFDDPKAPDRPNLMIAAA